MFMLKATYTFVSWLNLGKKEISSREWSFSLVTPQIGNDEPEPRHREEEYHDHLQPRVKNISTRYESG